MVNNDKIELLLLLFSSLSVFIYICYLFKKSLFSVHVYNVCIMYVFTVLCVRYENERKPTICCLRRTFFFFFLGFFKYERILLTERIQLFIFIINNVFLGNEHICLLKGILRIRICTTYRACVCVCSVYSMCIFCYLLMNIELGKCFPNAYTRLNFGIHMVWCLLAHKNPLSIMGIKDTFII